MANIFRVSHILKIYEVTAKYGKRGKYLLYCTSKHAITGLSLKLTELNLSLPQYNKLCLENECFFELKKTLLFTFYLQSGSVHQKIF